jgi:hypothetical protein
MLALPGSECEGRGVDRLGWGRGDGRVGHRVAIE